METMNGKNIDLSWCTPQQLAALGLLRERWAEAEILGKELAGPALMVRVPGMVIGIEPDGYAHS